MPAVTRKMANDARNGINTAKLTDQDYELLNIPRKRVQRCGICKLPGHKCTNCNIFAYKRDSRPSQDAMDYRDIVRRCTACPPQTEYEYMEKWIEQHGTHGLTEKEMFKYVTNVNTFTKRLLAYRLTTAKNSQPPYGYWF